MHHLSQSHPFKHWLWGGLAYIYMYIHTYIHTLHTYIYTYIYIYIHTIHTIHTIHRIHTYIHIYIHTYNTYNTYNTYMHTYTYIYIYIYITYQVANPKVPGNDCERCAGLAGLFAGLLLGSPGWPRSGHVANPDWMMFYISKYIWIMDILVLIYT